jgi:hypothetical protein
METILPVIDEITVDEIRAFLETLSPEEKRQVNALILGARLGKMFGDKRNEAILEIIKKA